MEIINKKNDKITFSAEIEESLANAIRRSINEISVLAIDEVEISKNDSALYDETISHRMGLISLKSKKALTEKSEIKLKLEVKKDGIVYAEELKGDAEIVYPKTPITLLKKGQEIEIIATAKVGKGSTHPKFSPGFMFYRNIAEIKLEKDCPKEIINACPKKVFVEESGKVVVKDIISCDLCEECIEECRKQGKEGVKIIPSKELLISVESFGQLSVEDIFKKAIEILKQELNSISKHLK